MREYYGKLSAHWVFAMKCLALLSMPVLATALTIAPCHAVEIQNFRSGLVCDVEMKFPAGNIPVSWVCFETETLDITGQGQCTYDGREEKCTWYGFEFDYSNAGEEEISCVSTSSVPTTIGNPKGVEAEDVTVHEWSFTLPPGNGHYFHPQYSVALARLEPASNDEETVCSVGGRELYRYRFTKIYPVLTDTLRESVSRRLRKMQQEQIKQDGIDPKI